MFCSERISLAIAALCFVVHPWLLVVIYMMLQAILLVSYSYLGLFSRLIHPLSVRNSNHVNLSAIPQRFIKKNMGTCFSFRLVNANFIPAKRPSSWKLGRFCKHENDPKSPDCVVVLTRV